MQVDRVHAPALGLWPRSTRWISASYYIGNFRRQHLLLRLMLLQIDINCYLPSYSDQRPSGGEEHQGQLQICKPTAAYVEDRPRPHASDKIVWFMCSLLCVIFDYSLVYGAFSSC